MPPRGCPPPQVTFTVRVRAEACLEAPQNVTLRVLGVPEQLQLGVRTLCHCPCTQRAPSTPLCRGGDLDCGVCRCGGSGGGNGANGGGRGCGVRWGEMGSDRGQWGQMGAMGSRGGNGVR